MADNRRKFLGPNAGTIRDPTSNAKEHGRMRNPPRYLEMGAGMQSRGMKKNDRKVSKPGDTT